MSHNLTPFWGAAQTQVNRENLAEMHLRKQGFECWCPRLQKTVRSGRRSIEKLKPLFPGYIFVRIQPQTRWRSIDGTIGVLRLVKAGGMPATLPIGFVDKLRANIDEFGGVQFDDSIGEGDQVRVVSGAFDNWFGTVLHMPDRDRVTLLLQMIGRDVPVTVNRGRVVKAA
ncbi:MAG: transcription termination/antitermination NusG family protein [Pseudomonadota bacterium]